MNDLKHISKDDLYAFEHNTMNQRDKEIFLEHIVSCDYCADQFAALMAEDIIEAPREMKANILQATKRPEIQLAIRVRETSKQMQLFLYSLKVGAATAVALLLLVFSMNFTSLTASIKPAENPSQDTAAAAEEYIPLTAVIRNNMDALTNSILDFSNNIMKTEVTNND